MFNDNVTVQVYRKKITHNWEPWFAWFPVTRQDGSKVWLKKVYRRKTEIHIDNDEYSITEYGDDFDILKDTNG